MKAQFVYEALDFERGREPKKALKIGSHREIKKGDLIIVDFLYKESKNLYGKKVRVIAIGNEGEDAKGKNLNISIGERIFSGRIVEPEYPGAWFVTYDNRRKEWIIE